MASVEGVKARLEPEKPDLPGGKKRKCKRTPLHPHCKSVKWGSMYRALRRKGYSKEKAARISNERWNQAKVGRIKRKSWGP